jgi:hypothetical protein
MSSFWNFRLQTGIGYFIKKGTTFIPLQRLWNLGASRVAKIRETSTGKSANLFLKMCDQF